MGTPLTNGSGGNGESFGDQFPGPEMGNNGGSEHARILSILRTAVNHAQYSDKYPYDMDTDADLIALPGTAGLGTRMRKLRLKRGLTVVAVAKVMGISDSALSQIESGRSKNAKLDGFLKFCTFFGEDPYFLVFGESRASATGSFQRLDKPFET